MDVPFDPGWYTTVIASGVTNHKIVCVRLYQELCEREDASSSPPGILWREFPLHRE